MKAYKLVLNRRGMKFSVTSDDLPTPVRPEWVVLYSTEYYAEAPKYLANLGYHLLTFKDQLSAESFMNWGVSLKSLPYTELWTADAVGKMPLRPFLHQLAEKIVENDLAMIIGDVNMWPEGTQFHKKVKLLERVL